MTTYKDISNIIFRTFIDCFCYKSLIGVKMYNISMQMIFEGDY